MTVSSPTTVPSAQATTIFLAADLGKSACKFVYRVGESKDLCPIWIEPSTVAESVPASALARVESGMSVAPENAAYLEMEDGSLTIVGSMAGRYSNSFSEDKEKVAAFQVVSALGILAERLNVSELSGTIMLALPFSEMRSKDVISDRVRQFGQGCRFRGRELRFDVEIACVPEGGGLYFLYFGYLGGKTPMQRVPVVMLGHRNASILCFESGRFSPGSSSTSDDRGFKELFAEAAMAVGIREREQPSLMAALSTGKPTQLSATKGKLFDYSEAVARVKASYLTALDSYFQDNLLPLLIGSGSNPAVIIGGGASYLIRGELHEYMQDHGANAVFADTLSTATLSELAQQTPNAIGDATRALRFADAYGLSISL